MFYIQKFIAYLKFEKRYSQHTQSAYEADLRHFNKYLKKNYETNIKDAKSEMIRSWMMFMISHSSSKRSINRKLSSLRQFYKYLLKVNIILLNPMIRIDSLNIDKKIPSFISKNEMLYLLDNITYKNDFFGLRDREIIQMFYNTGIRLSELISLKIEDVDFSQKQVKVFGKRSKERVIPLLPSHLEHLSNYIYIKENLFKNSVHLFTTNNGDILYPKFVYRIVNSYLRKVTKVHQKSPHVLRHAFATHMLNDGADLNAVKEILGHVSLSSTQIYTHSSAEHLKSIYKQAHPRGDK